MERDNSIISVITPNYNTEKEIIEFLDSLLTQDYSLNLIEIIVVDNGSTDDSVMKVKKWFNINTQFYRTQLLELPNNLGIAFAYNKGYENLASESKIIIRTESDVELEKNCVSSLVDTLLTNEDSGIVGAKGIFFNDKRTLNHAARYLNWWNGKVKELDTTDLLECDFVFGATFAVRIKIVKEIGYFFRKGRFFASELELCTRVKKFGYKVLCQPNAISYHKGGNTTGKTNRKKFSFIDLRELTLFHLQYNKFPSKLFALSFSFFWVCKNFLNGNVYPIWGFLSGLFSFILNKDVLMPVDNKSCLISDWVFD